MFIFLLPFNIFSNFVTYTVNVWIRRGHAKFERYEKHKQWTDVGENCAEQLQELIFTIRNALLPESSTFL